MTDRFPTSTSCVAILHSIWCLLLKYVYETIELSVICDGLIAILDIGVRYIAVSHIMSLQSKCREFMPPRFGYICN